MEQNNDKKGLFGSILGSGLEIGSNIIKNIPTDKVSNVASTASDLIPSSIKKTGSNILNKAIGLTLDTIPLPQLIELTQTALNMVSPVKISLSDSITEKQIVITQEEVNKYIKEHLKNNPEIKDLKVTLLDHNIVQLDVKVDKLKATLDISQRLILKSFKINKNESYIQFKMTDTPKITSNTIWGKTICLLSSFLLNSVINEDLLKKVDPENISVNDDKVITVNLKDKALEKVYNQNFNNLLSKTIPVIGEKFILDFLSVKNIITQNEKVLIDISISLLNK